MDLPLLNPQDAGASSRDKVNAAIARANALATQLASVVAGLDALATDAELAALAAVVGGKASVGDVASVRDAVTALTAVVGGKASAVALAALTDAVAGKAAAGDLASVRDTVTALTAVVGGKASTGDLASVRDTVAALTAVVGGKATPADVATVRDAVASLTGVVGGKASTGDLATVRDAVAALTQALEGKASAGDLAALTGVVSGKATPADVASVRDAVTALTAVVGGKATATALAALTDAVAGKAAAGDLASVRDTVTALTAVVGGKASTGDLASVRDTVTALTAVVGGKATPADVATVRDAVASLTGVVGGKASTGDLASVRDTVTALTAVVGGKATPADVATVRDAVASLTGVVGGKASTGDLATVRDAVAALTAVVGGKASTGDLSLLAGTVADIVARLARVNAGVYPAARPGDTPTAFTALPAGGDPDALAPLDPAVYPVRVVGDGLGVEVSASREVWERTLHAVETTRLWWGRWQYVRTQPAQDPENDSVAALIRWYAPDRSPIGAPIAVETVTPSVGVPHEFTAFIGIAGTTGVTITRPEGAVYFRVGIKSFGVEPRTVVTDLQADDVSAVSDAVRRLVPPDALPALGVRIDDVLTALAAEATTARKNETAIGNSVDSERDARIGTDNQLIDIVIGEPRTDPRDGFSLAWALYLFLNQRALAGFEPDGRWITEKLGVQAAPLTRDGDEHVGGIIDMLSQLYLGLLRDGDLSFSGNTAIPTRDGRSHQFSIYEDMRRVLLGFDDLGRADLRLSPYAAVQAAKALYIAPHAEWRGTVPVFNVRRAPAGLVALVQEADGKVSDVIQRAAVPGRPANPTAVAAHVDPMRAVLGYGQSESGHGANNAAVSPSTLVTSLYPHHALTLNIGPSRHVPDGLIDPAAISDYIANADRSDRPPLGMTAFAAAREAFLRRAGGASSGMATFVSWYGGQPVGQFLPGTVAWKNLLTAAAGIAALADSYGKPLDSIDIDFDQGQNFEDAGPEQWRAGANVIFDAVRSEVAMAAGRNVGHLFFSQTNQGNTPGWTASGNELVQLEIARARLGQGVTCYGPFYDLPFADDIHAGAIGQMVRGERKALIYNLVKSGTTFNPLWHVNIERSGVDIDITFQLPPSGGPLAWDTTWLPVVPGDNMGFVYSDDGNSAAISSVTIISTNKVRIKLTGVPTGDNKKINYGRGQTNLLPWANGRGNLISPTGVPSRFHELGYAVPPTINHPCMRFVGDVP